MKTLTLYHVRTNEAHNFIAFGHPTYKGDSVDCPFCFKDITDLGDDYAEFQLPEPEARGFTYLNVTCEHCKKEFALPFEADSKNDEILNF